MNKETLIERLMSTFLDEMDEQVAVLNRDLIHLEKFTPGHSEYEPLLRSVFRTVHSLKGASRSVDLAEIERACHVLEELFGEVRSGVRTLDKDLFSKLFATADALLDLGIKMRNKQSADQNTLAELIMQIEVYLSGPSPEESSELPSAALLADQAKTITDAKATSAILLPTAQNNSENSFQYGASATAPKWNECSSVRVASGKLDGLLKQSGELLTVYRRTETWLDKLNGLHDFVKTWEGESRRSSTVGNTDNRLKDTCKQVDRLMSTMKADIRVLNETARQVDEEIRSLRMRPFSELCLGVDRTIRDIASAGGKEVEVVTDGCDVELDRAVIEKLKSPLMHILRNAIQHGIETVDERSKRNKPAMGRISISASLKGSQVEVKIEDDGRGIDLHAIKAQAIRKGLPEPQTDEEASRLIFLPWFSTSETVNEISGRGVGLDVVASELLSLQGSIEVAAGAESGTCFTLTMPLTLSKIRALFVKVSDQVFAFSSNNIEVLLRVDPAEIRVMQGMDVLAVRGRFVPVVPLAEALQLGGEYQYTSGKLVPIAVIRHGNSLRAYAVDELLMEQETVVTALGPRLPRVKNISGASLLPNGDIALIINSAELLSEKSAGSLKDPKCKSVVQEKSKKRLIVADDSMTTRILETSILESAGYEVFAVADGQSAWELLNASGADLLVSDVEMPRMDGFTLTQTIRASAKWSNLPVVLVTSLSREADRSRGMEAGANAYVAKGEFDQTDLLEAVAQLA